MQLIGATFAEFGKNMKKHRAHLVNERSQLAETHTHRRNVRSHLANVWTVFEKIRALFTIIKNLYLENDQHFNKLNQLFARKTRSLGSYRNINL